MSFDLIGLPPTYDEVQAFARAMAHDRSRAINELIERLLFSPAYGEQWGRHWLDLARYSDTKGYVYSREERFFVHSPSYRDWVVRAFNEDMPYDRFLLLQIAADQLVPNDSPDLAAMGFLTGGRRFIGVTHDIIDDRIDAVTRGTMALTVQCARCHDHKYDPIPTKDYYSLYGVFHGSDDRLVQLAPSQDEELAKRRHKLAEMMGKRRDEAATRLRARVADYLNAQFELRKYPEEGFDQIFSPDDIIPASVRRWRDYLHVTRNPADPIFGPWHVLAEAAPEEFGKAAERLSSSSETLNPMVAAAFARPAKDMREVARRYGEIFADAERGVDAPGAAELRSFLRAPSSPTVVPDLPIASNEQFFPTTEVEELWKLQGDVDRRLIELGLPVALVATEHEREPDPRVFKRGSPSQPGEEVSRRFLQVLEGSDRRPFSNGNGRLELARAIATERNPLTARVMVNRIWQHHFGNGLVRTPSDFGLRADSPSHPELLDWLALRFVASGWSVKEMHRLILSSAVYQTASRADDENSKDHDNRLLAHYPIRRLTFEQTRDAMLAVSEELNRKMGGKPSELLDNSNKRRTVYSLVDRQYLPGVLRTFDFANPDIHVAVRHETTVPQQALFFLNGTFAASRARSLASMTCAEAPEARVRHLYRALFQRDACARDLRDALEFVGQAPPDPEPDQSFIGPPAHPPYLKPWEQYAQVLLLANEFSFLD